MATLKLRPDRHGTPRYWTLTWSDDEGPHRVIIGTVDDLKKSEAEKILQAKRAELSTGLRFLGLGARPNVPTFEQYALDYLVWHQAEYPDSNYRIAQIVHDHLIPKF